MDSRESLNSYPKKKKVGEILTVDNLINLSKKKKKKTVDNLIRRGISILSYTGAVFVQVVVNLWIIC